MDSFNGVMQLLGGKPQGQQQAGTQQQRQQAQQQWANQQQQSQPAYNEPHIDFSDDIPFAPVGLQFGGLHNCI